MASRKRLQHEHGFPSAGGALARIAFAHAQARGIELDPLLKKAGLTRRQIENPKIWIPVRHQIQFVNLVAETIGDDRLGFNLGVTFDLRKAGLLYYVMASSDVLIEALRRGARYTAVANEGIAQMCQETGSAISLVFRYVGVSRHSDRHQIEFWLVCVARLVRHLSGRRLTPVRVRIAHMRKPIPAEFTEYFGSDVAFGARKDEIVLDRRIVDLPVTSADPHLNSLLLDYCEQALTHRRRQRGSFRSSVENAIAPLLPHGKPRADTVARELGLGPRTLARRLEVEGLTFSSLLEELRQDLARRYLADEHLSISQIAWLLGDREIAAFSHAFKRVTGKTPREARSNISRRQ
jgi:AraC-like DNA-binding protein